MGPIHRFPLWKLRNNSNVKRARWQRFLMKLFCISKEPFSEKSINHVMLQKTNFPPVNIGESSMHNYIIGLKQCTQFDWLSPRIYYRTDAYIADSMLHYICSVMYNRRRQNVVSTLVAHSGLCSYHNMMSSVICYWTDTQKHGIYLLNLISPFLRSTKRWRTFAVNIKIEWSQHPLRSKKIFNSLSLITETFLTLLGDIKKSVSIWQSSEGLEICSVITGTYRCLRKAQVDSRIVSTVTTFHHPSQDLTHSLTAADWALLFFPFLAEVSSAVWCSLLWCVSLPLHRLSSSRNLKPLKTVRYFVMLVNYASNVTLRNNLRRKRWNTLINFLL